MDVRATMLDYKGTVTTTSAALSKQELCAKFGIPPRDLRKLDSGVPTVVPTILSRKSCIILTILHLRVAITAREVTIFDSVGSEDSYFKGLFVWSLEHALKTTPKAAHGLPYEFRALEACLVNVLTALETDLVNIRSHVVELLAHMEEHIDRENLRLLLSYSRRLSIFQKRATLVQECLEEVLSNDADLAAMYLTAKLQGKPRTAEDHEEIELLLESFSKQCEEIVSEVETLSSNVKHTEDIIELILDSNRNSLLGLDLRVSIATLGLTAGAMVAALFGMLTSTFEDSPFAFYLVTASAFAASGITTGFMLRRLSRLRKVNLGWREELRQAGDRWARGERIRRARRRD
ncbi:magnesium ion transporter [Rhodosporidiobolus nylandii]